MAARIFAPAKWSGAGAPEVESVEYATGQTFNNGEPVEYSGTTGTVIVCTANPQAVAGVALEDAGSKPGYGIGHVDQVGNYTGRVQEVSMAVASRQTVFSGVGSSAAAITQIGTDYGLAVASNLWTVDLTEEGTVTVMVVDVDVANNIIFFKFLEAVLELP